MQHKGERLAERKLAPCGPCLCHLLGEFFPLLPGRPGPYACLEPFALDLLKPARGCLIFYIMEFGAAGRCGCHQFAEG